MKLQIDASGAVLLDTDTLSSFARTKARGEGASPFAGFRRSFGDAGQGDALGGVRRDVPASVERTYGGLLCRIGASADAVFFDGRTLTCESRFAVRKNPERVFPADDPARLAKAMCTAYMLAENEGLESIALRLCYYRDGEAACYEAMFARAVLARAFDALFERAAPFIEAEAIQLTDGRTDLAQMKFPYGTIREGQRDLMEEIFRCIRTGQRILASAPTGIGKTMSGLFPSLRALGRGHADRIFYFTAKTVTGNAALDAVRLIAGQAKHLRCIRLTAKERLCPRRRGGESGHGMCRKCGNLAIREGVSYEERRDAAVLALLACGCVLDTPQIEKTAEKYGICPHELSLDASEYCDVIVCDYGYLLDPAVRLKRYFTDPRGERYIFLFDEAHNIPDRAREIYSAALSRMQLESFAETVTAALPDDEPLREAIDGMRAALDGVEALCAENEEESDGESRGGYCLETEIPAFLPQAALKLRDVCSEYLRRDYENAAPLFEDMRQALRQFCEAAAWADEHFTFYAESHAGELLCRIMCLDPAALLDNAFAKARCTALFSATLSPMEYYVNVCGCTDAVTLELSSPYEQENLCLVTVDSVSTRFSQRKNSASEVAELIETVISAREGNYIVYFPSYKYMEAVCRQYLRLSPSVPVIMQKPGMSIAERSRFLKQFEKSAKSGEGVAAFCVLGGIYSEGIDLQGEALIGTVIVGIGLPGLSSELNILADYYERTRESGRDYAYLFPAMNKILQAAGRVIRSETDRGVVVLIDDRYADPGIRRLMPPHWSRMQYTGDPYALSVILQRFWEEEE